MFILSVANRRSTPVGAKVNVSQICEQRDFFGSVEIYCGLAFVYYCILRQLSTFIVHLNFLQVFLYVLFITEKNQKVPARGKPSRSLLCSGVASNILQSKSPCHLNLSVDFWVMRTVLS